MKFGYENRKWQNMDKQKTVDGRKSKCEGDNRFFARMERDSLPKKDSGRMEENNSKKSGKCDCARILEDDIPDF